MQYEDAVEVVQFNVDAVVCLTSVFGLGNICSHSFCFRIVPPTQSISLSLLQKYASASFRFFSAFYSGKVMCAM